MVTNFKLRVQEFLGRIIGRSYIEASGKSNPSSMATPKTPVRRAKKDPAESLAGPMLISREGGVQGKETPESKGTHRAARQSDSMNRDELLKEMRTCFPDSAPGYWECLSDERLRSLTSIILRQRQSLASNSKRQEFPSGATLQRSEPAHPKGSGSCSNSDHLSSTKESVGAQLQPHDRSSTSKRVNPGKRGAPIRDAVSTPGRRLPEGPLSLSDEQLRAMAAIVGASQDGLEKPVSDEMIQLTAGMLCTMYGEAPSALTNEQLRFVRDIVQQRRQEMMAFDRELLKRFSTASSCSAPYHKDESDSAMCS